MNYLKKTFAQSKWGQNYSRNSSILIFIGCLIICIGNEEDYLTRINKSKVLQDAKAFNNKHLNEKEARNVLAKLVYLYN